MFLRFNRRFKDGKEHRYWNIVESKRCAGGRVVQRQVLYLGEINDSQQRDWCRAIEVFDEGTLRHTQLALFPADRAVPDCPGAGGTDQRNQTGNEGKRGHQNWAKPQLSAFDTGFVDVFARRLRTLAPRLRVVNYACPGESTRTFVAGGCTWLAGGRGLHDPFHGAQLDAALAFLRAHPDEVSPITINLGGNDVDAFAKACKGSFACARARLPRFQTQFTSRLGSILRRLRVVAPKAEVIVVGVWNDDLATIRQSDPLYRRFDLAIARVAAAARAYFADPFPLFDPQGSLARRKARICAFTFTCSWSPPDGHPTDAGYRAIAAAVFAASGYAHRS